MSEIQFAVRFYSRSGSHVVPAETLAQAETWAANHAKLSGCWAELLSREIPEWAAVKQYGERGGS